MGHLVPFLSNEIVSNELPKIFFSGMTAKVVTFERPGVLIELPTFPAGPDMGAGHMPESTLRRDYMMATGNDNLSPEVLDATARYLQMLRDEDDWADTVDPAAPSFKL